LTSNVQDSGVETRSLTSEWGRTDGRSSSLEHGADVTIQKVLDALPGPVAVVDTRHIIRLANSAWHEFMDRYGYDWPAHGIGQDYFAVGLKYGAIDRISANHIAASIDLVASGQKSQIVRNYQLSLGEGADRHFTMTISPLSLERERLIVMSHVDVTAAVHLTEARRDAAAAVLRAQDEERNRIARELHDATAQTIAAIGIGHARLRATDGDETRKLIMAELDDLVRDAGRQVRLQSFSLHSPEIEIRGLEVTLKSYIEGLSQRSGLNISFEWQVPHRSRIARYKPALLRIVQEALWNVHQHSGASDASVTIIENDESVALTVADSGKGIDLTQKQAGLGLISMRERTEELGGKLTIESTGTGTRIEVRFPLAVRVAP
jgi:signal transduction histidine kinase